MATEVQPLPTIKIELIPMPIDPYTTEEDYSDLNQIEISSMSTYDKCEET